MDELLARAWRLAGPLRGWLAWVLHTTFAVGVTGVVREVREETGLTVSVGSLIEVRVGDRYRAEVYYEAVLVGGLDGLALQESEILEARLFALDDLPAAMPPTHREFAGRSAAP